MIRLVLLVGLGFGVGLLFGLVTQEPELLVNHLQGESESVQLAGEIDPGNEVIAGTRAEPRDPQGERLALLEAAGEPTAAALPVVAAAAESTAPADLWAIQVGAFSDESAAEQLIEGLDEKGYPVELIPATDATPQWRVRVQPVEGESAARDLANRLKRQERLPTWVISMEAGSGS